jgi:hypothetical protein
MITGLKKLSLLAVAAIMAVTLVSVSSASAQPDGPAKGVSALYTVAPACIDRVCHDHGSRKEVHLRNFCGGTWYVKVIVAYGPDSGCIRLDNGVGWLYWWEWGWPWAASRLDRVELC